MRLEYGFCLFLLLSSAYAYANKSIESCNLELGTMQLQEPTEIRCFEGSLRVADGTIIVTNGYELQIESTGDLQLGGENGLRIVSFEPGQRFARDAGLVEVHAVNATGVLSVENDGVLNGAGGDIVLKFIALEDFHILRVSNLGHGMGVDGGIEAVMNTVTQDLSDFFSHTLE